MADNLAQLADVLEKELRIRAKKLGWSATPNEAALVEKNDLGIDGVLGALSSRGATVAEEALPVFRRAFDLQPAALSLLVCGLDEEHADESYRAALWWAGLVRSRITPVRRGDLHLFLIAPPGTAGKSSWRERRSRLEADERFCRKFVWLPSLAPEPQEVGSFLDRTFLAEPWAGESAEPQSLDPMERLVEDLGGSNSLTVEEAHLWIGRLGEVGESGYQQMAEDLVAILEGKR